MTMRIPKNIKKEHIISALNEIDREGYPKEHESTKFYLLYEGRKYPPKWVIRTANIFANAIPFETILFSGGEQSNNFLKKFGFRIQVLNNEKIEYARRMLSGKAESREDIPCSTCKHYQIMYENNSWLKPYEVENSSRFEWLQELQDDFLRGRARRIKVFFENQFMSQ
jgi:hypothetical protein